MLEKMADQKKNVRRSTVFVFILIFSFCDSIEATNQSALLKKIFSNYHTDVIPLCEGSPGPIDVYVGIAVRQVIELNEPKQILTLNAWMRLAWFDCQLIWNVSEYGGIDNLVLPFQKIWTPDITLYDNAADELTGLKDYRPSVNSDGKVTYLFPTVIDSLCRVDVTYFPFDTQKCPLTFGSWAYTGSEVDIWNKSATGDISSFKVNTEWTLESVPLKRTVTLYPSSPEPYPDVTFYVTLRRKPLFYVLNLLFPCILITSVAMLGFLLPPDAGEKVSLEITVLLSLAVFLLVVSETLPPTSENFPFIGIYFACAMVMVSVSTILTVFVLNFHFKGQHGRPVPRWIRKVFLGGLARVLLVKDYEASVHPQREVDDFTPTECSKKQKPHTNGVLFHVNNHNGTNGIHRNQDSEVRQMDPILGVMTEQLNILKKVQNEFADQEKKERLNSEWQRVAMVMDRLFLLLFFLFTVICTLAILLQCIIQ
ncbi:neuronal acetylcholine receptor subunit alpha-10 [Patella vulgata]|uniref:neuronal acetylcholine receptor subunit alpha-10 n=1 Tax=Patella vulgata TaxID=6465 RepID=UPI0021808EA5|nr:neuronal acetylcholine receptor subunit alpha-10 [Patella vulgata]